MPMFLVPFTVDGENQTIIATGIKAIRAGSKNYWYADFTFKDNTFDGLEYISATFSTEPYSRNRGRAKVVPLENGRCQIPWEVLTRKGTVYVGLFAGDMLVTDEAEIEVTSAAPTLGGESQPTESWYDKFEESLAEKQDALTAGENITIEDNVISATGGGSTVGAVRYDEAQTLTNAEKAQARTNIGAVVYDDTELAARVSTIEGKESGWDAKYTKPNGGIPASDLADGVIPTVPTKTSDLTNDSGFVDAVGAAAVAPVQSVNGQTGAVTITVPSTAADVGAIAAPSSPANGAFLVWNGTAWVAQSLSTWQGGNY